MLPLHVTLQYYKRPEVQRALIEQGRGKEIAVRFGDRFGKRPDVLVYESDVLSFAQKKATSFHISEETWSNPMQLNTGMRKQDLDNLRVGWDLILDVDFPFFNISKEITHGLVQTLIKQKIPKDAISCKFSGNKGFHIGVPFQVFPDSIMDADGTELLTSDLFPDVVKYLVEYLALQLDGPDNDYAFTTHLKSVFPQEVLAPHLINVDVETGKKVAVDASGNLYVCPACDWSTRTEEEYVVCEKCNAFMQQIDEQKKETALVEVVDLAIDTMLVSSRHMYRMAYSLHEKSGLVSVPVDVDSILSFEKSIAAPEIVAFRPFLSRVVPQECGRALLEQAVTYAATHKEERKAFAEVQWEGDAAPEELFPPTIHKLLGPLRDGRKRALFVLTNFLRSVGWNYEMIEARLYEWNKQHPEPLREGDISNHLRYHKQKNQSVLPPNFDNTMYYHDLGVLVHDELSKRLKNPVQYVRLKIKQQGGS